MKRLLAAAVAIAYSAILIKVMVFKEMPTIRIGHVRMRFAGTVSGRPANFLPFRTIWPYLRGHQGLMIAGVNLVGNIAPLVPIGLLLPIVRPHMTWRECLALGAAAGFVIEIMQVVLRVGIFDIDDVMLNALGVTIGYWMSTTTAGWVRARRGKSLATSHGA